MFVKHVFCKIIHTLSRKYFRRIFTHHFFAFIQLDVSALATIIIAKKSNIESKTVNVGIFDIHMFTKVN